jgi:hypothetical protein
VGVTRERIIGRRRIYQNTRRRANSPPDRRKNGPNGNKAGLWSIAERNRKGRSRENSKRESDVTQRTNIARILKLGISRTRTGRN